MSEEEEIELAELELAKRMEAFARELVALLARHGADLGPEPVYGGGDPEYIRDEWEVVIDGHTRTLADVLEMGRIADAQQNEG